MKEVLLKEYNNLKNLKLEPKDQKYVIKYNFIKGAFVEILGEKPGEFEIEFFDKDKNEIVHKGKIGNNMWTRTNIKYYVNYHVKITDLSFISSISLPTSNPNSAAYCFGKSSLFLNSL